MPILLFWLLAPGLAQAGDDVVVVSRDQTSTTFSVDALLANDPRPAFQSFVPPSRGELYLEAGSFVYTPGQAFLDHGSDSFRYHHEEDLTSTVFLVADLKAALANAFEGNGPPPAPWQTILEGPGNELEPGAQSLLVDYAGEGVAHLRHDHADEPSSPSGGDTVVEVAPGPYTCTPPVSGADCAARLASGETVLAAVRDAAEAPIFEILLAPGSAGSGSHLLRARAHQTAGAGSPVDTASTLLATGTPHTVTLSWWLASAPASRDGGLLLRLDGQLIATAAGVDNFGLTPALQDFGVAAESLGLALRLDIAAIEVWTAGRPARFPPLFADGGEEGHLQAWDGISEPPLLAATTASALSGAWGIEVAVSAADSAQPYLVDRSPAGVDAAGSARYRARFQLDAADLAMPAGRSLTLLRGLEEGGTDKLFLVKLRQRVDGIFEVRALARQDDGSLPGLPWHPLPATVPAPSVAILELLWWTADDKDPGGLRLWVDGDVVGARSLDNGASRLHEIRWGASARPDGTTGALYLDEFESWR